MKIRKTTLADLREILEIYAYARMRMKQNGNPFQWGDHKPSREIVLEDIRKGQSYIMEENGHICGVFAFIIGNDPTYQVIEQGRWLNEAPYGTIHRIAGNGSVKGLFVQCLSYCMAQLPNIRIDTHQDNRTMRHLLEQNDFRQCGIIYVEDGSSRIAFQKCP